MLARKFMVSGIRRNIRGLADLILDDLSKEKRWSSTSEGQVQRRRWLVLDRFPKAGTRENHSLGSALGINATFLGPGMTWVDESPIIVRG